ncbi:MAG: hypothetical protein NTV21_12615 [Planctomycetota bacterium]|nr:hypothetical protein [Planctomycetota bacterium]
MGKLRWALAAVVLGACAATQREQGAEREVEVETASGRLEIAWETQVELPKGTRGFDSTLLESLGDVDGDGVPDLALIAWLQFVSVSVRGGWGVAAVSGADGRVLTEPVAIQWTPEVGHLFPAGTAPLSKRSVVTWMTDQEWMTRGPVGPFERGRLFELSLVDGKLDAVTSQEPLGLHSRGRGQPPVVFVNEPGAPTSETRVQELALGADASRSVELLAKDGDPARDEVWVVHERRERFEVERADGSVATAPFRARGGWGVAKDAARLRERDGDGIAMLVVSSGTTQAVFRFPLRPDGSAEAQRVFVEGLERVDEVEATEDLNADGTDELLVRGRGSNGEDMLLLLCGRSLRRLSALELPPGFESDDFSEHRLHVVRDAPSRARAFIAGPGKSSPVICVTITP